MFLTGDTVMSSMTSERNPAKIAIHKTNFTRNEDWTLEVYCSDLKHISDVKYSAGEFHNPTSMLFKVEIFNQNMYLFQLNVTDDDIKPVSYFRFSPDGEN